MNNTGNKRTVKVCRVSNSLRTSAGVTSRVVRRPRPVATQRDIEYHRERIEEGIGWAGRASPEGFRTWPCRRIGCLRQDVGRYRAVKEEP